jgi:hydroxyacylglutathione hydrolase
MQSWIETGFEQAHLPQESVRELADRLQEDGIVLDVRSEAEWNSGHISGAVHLPGGHLPERVDEVPAGRPVHVICGSGYRSSIAASVLARSGRQNIINVVGGMAAWNAQKLPTDPNSASQQP